MGQVWKWGIRIVEKSDKRLKWMRIVFREARIHPPNSELRRFPAQARKIGDSLLFSEGGGQFPAMGAEK